MNGFFPIHLSQLTPNFAHPFHLYLQIEGRPVMLRPAEEVLPSEKFLYMMEKSQLRLWIPKKHKLFFNEYLAKKILASNSTPEEKAVAIKETAWIHISDLYTKPELKEVLVDSHSLIATMIDYISAEPSGISNLLQLSAHDSYTYNHSLDVAVYCLALAQRLFPGDKDMIFKSGLGGLLHDIGKRKVSLEIINKPGPLSNVEWGIMKKHPEWGQRCLNEASPEQGEALSPEVIAAVTQHHESYDGSGYPFNLTGDEIHPTAKIAALADVFDALTTNRSYSRAMSYQNAIEFMVEKISHRFDPEMFKLFKQSLKTTSKTDQIFKKKVA